MALSARQHTHAGATTPSRRSSVQPARASLSTAAARQRQRQRPSQQQQQQQQQLYNEQPVQLQRHERLRDPASFSSRGSTTVMVNDAGGPVSLATYMQLPFEQWTTLDTDRITMDHAASTSTSSSSSSATFTLHVPRVALLGAALEPVIRVRVSTEGNGVELNAIDCRLNATGPGMGGLDDKFAMRFQTRLTWESLGAAGAAAHGDQQQQQQPAHLRRLVPATPVVQQQQHAREAQQLAAEQQQLAAAAAEAAAAASQQPRSNGAGGAGGSAARRSIRAGWQQLTGSSWAGASASSSSSSSSSSTGVSTAAAAARLQSAPPPAALLRGSITAASVVEVWCEVIPPFNLMPRGVLESTCSTVVSGLVASLLPWFARELAKDYGKWATDAGYRAARAARSQAPAAGSEGGSSSTA